MAIQLSCQNLSKTYGARPLFEGLSFGLFEGERTGLIGPNGAGKSTLLKILAGRESPDGGELALRRGLNIRYLAQQDRFEDEENGLTAYEELTQALQGLGLEDYEIMIRVEDGLASSGLDGDQRVDRLSGGWRKRLAILAQVLCEPDLLLLDEPTNHLDLEGVLWLERLMTEVRFSFLVITHDRRFLESVCNRVIELNKRYADGHFSSVGNYSDFIESREALFDAQAAQEDSARNIVRREVAWLRKGPKARTTKQKARIDRAGELIEGLNELKFRNAQVRSAAIDFSSSERQTKRLAEFVQVEKSMGNRKLFGPLDLFLSPGDKVGLLGGNGSGKSTLLKVLAGHLEPDAGQIKRADGLKVVTFDQHREQLDLSLPLRKALCESGEHVYYKGNPVHVAGWADRFLFGKEQLDVPLSRLSGGEQARVLIARLMLKPADILLLDEPTNDLDIHSLEVLENSLMEFSGALVLVTHDRYLLDRVCQRILALDGRGNANFFADLSQWEDLRGDHEEPQVEPPPPPAKLQTPKLGLTPQESKELKKIEGKLHETEEKGREARLALEDPSIADNAEALMERQQRLADLEIETESLFKRWSELEERRKIN
ncbi:MAG: ABC-F family ATP-binding cassette domain-containing protein [Elusimicrobia bacterium]|nr:ABC-F family ATP-binding cassette domain-containing protein [Elusimicrobiota bacterium]